MITDEEILELITREFEDKTLGTTEQYLEIHQPVFDNGALKIARIDREKSDMIIAYLPVADERFWFAVYIDPEKKEIYNIGTESENIVSFIADSDTLTSTELQAFTRLKPTKFWGKGDEWPNKKSTYKYSHLEFIPNPEPDEFEDKLDKLLTFLEQDRESVKTLAANAETFVYAIMEFHRGNQLLGAAGINLSNLKRLSDLGLKISFDFSAWGEPFK